MFKNIVIFLFNIFILNEHWEIKKRNVETKSDCDFEFKLHVEDSVSIYLVKVVAQSCPTLSTHGL